MKRSRTCFCTIMIVITICLSITSAYSQQLTIYRGTGDDYAYSIQQTLVEGYVVAGYTNSYGVGSYDLWIMKLDSTGAITWQKTYGGTGNDYANSIQQTADEGYILVGLTNSFGAGSNDAWIMKLDGSGGVTWQKTYGGTGNDYANSIQQTADAGYIVAGITDSFGAGSRDIWIMKLDSTGAITWQKTYGGSDDDFGVTIHQTADAGYIMAAGTQSFGAGSRDIWIMKLDSTGAITWQKTYGGTDFDYATSIQQTQDGGYIVSGNTQSFGAGSGDAWIMKLDGSGAVTWQNTYGGAGNDYIRPIQQTQDAGYIVAGFSYSFGAGSSDAWIMKLDSTGIITWQKTYGGANDNYAESIQQTQNGGYIVAGDTYCLSAGDADAWILKLDGSGSIGSCPFEGISAAVVSATTVTGVDTTVVPVDTTVTGVDTSAIVSDTSASASQWCPLTEDTQRLKVGVTPKKKGEGIVQSAEGLISCPGTCQEEYNKGSMITLYADPSDLSTFLGWKPSFPGCEGTDPCLVTLDKKKSVKAVFQGPNKLKVVTTFKNEATGTVTSGDTFINCPGDCEELYKLGASVTLTATPGPDSIFVKWTGNPCKTELTNVCTFEVNKNTTVKAIFEPGP